MGERYAREREREERDQVRKPPIEEIASGYTRQRKTRVFFSETGTTMAEVVPESALEIAVEFFNESNRPLDVVADINAPQIPEIDKRKVEFPVGAKDIQTGTLKFKTPSRFESIAVLVTIQPRAGAFGFGRLEPVTETLTVRSMVPKHLETIRSPEVSKHLEEIKKLNQPLVLVPDVTKTTYDVTPIVGDVSTNPMVDFTIETTLGIPVHLNCDDRILNILKLTVERATQTLAITTEDQNNLRFFLSELRKYLGNQTMRGERIQVEGPIGDVHVKATGPGLVYMVYATQVSPKEDERVIKKIENVVAEAEKAKGSVAVLVTKLDEKAIELSRTKTINVIDIFHGIEARGVWTGDQVMPKFLAEKLGLTLVSYEENPKGSYTPAQFKDALDKIT